MTSQSTALQFRGRLHFTIVQLSVQIIVSILSMDSQLRDRLALDWDAFAKVDRGCIPSLRYTPIRLVHDHCAALPMHLFVKYYDTLVLSTRLENTPGG